jgi:predicted PurR-regulated permease PerM
VAVSNVDRFTLRAFTIGFSLLLLYLLWKIFEPFVGPILWAVLLAFLLFPLNARLRRRWNGRNGAAAMVMTIVVLGAVVIPMTLIGFLFVRQVGDLAKQVSGLVARYQIEKPADLFRLPALDRVVHWIDAKTPMTATDIQEWLVEAAKSGTDLAIAGSKSLVLSAVGFVVSLLLMLFILYFFFRDGDRMATELLATLPAEEHRKERLVAHVESVTKAVVFGTLLTALVQGALIGIAFEVSGLPSPVVFGVVAAIASLLPVGGTAFVWIPGAIVLFAQGHTGWGIAMVVWGALIVGSADNVLRPYFISGRAEISTLPVFFGVLGGIGAFGPIGMFLGPVVIALALAVVRFARDDASARVARDDAPGPKTSVPGP